MNDSQLVTEILRGLLLPVIVAAVTSIFTILIVDRYKTGRQFQVLLENLRREMRLALLSHPVNRESARLTTGAFVTYPVTTAQRLLIEPVTTKTLHSSLVESLQDYLLEALRINSLIQNAKLLIGAGQHLGSRGMAGGTTELLREALDTESTIEALIQSVLEDAANSSRPRQSGPLSSRNETT